MNVGLRENDINSSVQPSKVFDIATLNVCGLRRRSNFPEFLEFVKRFDLLCLNETKIDETDVAVSHFQGTIVYTSHESNRS